MAAGQRSDAEHYLVRALTLAAQLGMRPLVAHCRFGLAALRRRTGGAREAADHATTAAALFHELDMSR